MKPGSNSKRSRGRGNPRRPNSPRPHQTFESNGPEVRIRGTVNQVLEKYLALARDASSSGDYVSAENYFQHAEHYFRILNANGGQHGNQQRFPGQGGQPGQPGQPGQGGQGQMPQRPQGDPNRQGQPVNNGAPHPQGGNGGGHAPGSQGASAMPDDSEDDDFGPSDTTPASG